MTPAVQGLYGCGRLRDGEGGPLRPGGLGLTAELVDLAGFAPGDVVGDIGCGLGTTTNLLRAKNIRAVGVDVDLDALAGSETPFVAADAVLLPFADASLDGLIAECVLSTLADPARALAEWRRVLKPGGRLALSDVYSRAAAGGRSATRENLCGRLTAAGFRVERFEDRSDVLKRFVAQFVFAYGSLDALCGGGLDAAALGGRPGYALVVASRSRGDSDVR